MRITEATWMGKNITSLLVRLSISADGACCGPPQYWCEYVDENGKTMIRLTT